MAEIQIPIRSNKAQYSVSGEPKVINAYAEMGGSDQKSEYTLVPCAGLKSFGTDMGGKCRGMIYLVDQDVIYSVQDFGLFKIQEDGTNTKLATIPGQAECFFARNDAENPQILLVVEGKTYLIENDTVTLQVQYDFTPVGVTFVGGYFIFWTAQGRIYASDLRSVTVPPLRFVTAETDPDGLSFCVGVGQNLYAVGEKTTEVWSINGNTVGNFPLSLVKGAHLRKGSNSPHTAVLFNDVVAFVDNENDVQLLKGYTANSISTPEVCRLIESEADKSEIIAFKHQRGDNRFYVLKGTNWCKEINLETGLWADRESGIGEPWRARYHVKAWNRDIFGDTHTGLLLEGDYKLFTDLNEPQLWGFDTSTIHAHPNGIQFDRISFDAQRGVGGEKKAEMMLSYSDDNGANHTGYRQLSLGRKGERGVVVEARGLGVCRETGRRFRVRISDDVIRAISLISVDAEPVEL